MHAHGPMPEPRARREPQARHLGECATLLLIEVLVHVTAAARLDSIDNPVEAVSQNTESMHTHREHVRNRHWGPDDIGDNTVPDARRVLRSPDRAVTPAAPSVGVNLGPMLAVHFGCHNP